MATYYSIVMSCSAFSVSFQYFMKCSMGRGATGGSATELRPGLLLFNYFLRPRLPLDPIFSGSVGFWLPRSRGYFFYSSSPNSWFMVLWPGYKSIWFGKYILLIVCLQNDSNSNCPSILLDFRTVFVENWELSEC
jgi:hypothetical protein